ncbi:hypothetical protein P175DRAFT_0554941 [Aspergillus ochraceoroseus IBT 24754]|uniref:LysM domain-containing protein n=2 Tax=Aspergillus ochraceoroseus TaxID=138278 RepID=A0A2T5M150_9EURO|nr:uncharacterized protein P175DRAFT_0554941 [Aspergillus ochraceoroseus IBT 24754]KKK21518.1 hypothetical protein AOCH_006277 [Aspergillus ochraceoroseus]PTU22255.1 hypothetical protein P175DRAFT_0554941 [Aspergillus ochraceoroseus IBT 24754]
MPGSNTNCAQWITLTDFDFLNPEIDSNCPNLWAGQSYCVEAVGDISTYSGYVTGTSTTTTSIWYVTSTSIAWTDFATATPVTYNITSTTSSYPLTSGSLEKCFKVFDNTYGNIRCYDAASLFRVSIANFVLWNPSVLNGQNYSITGCTLQNETQYCGSYYKTGLP